MVVENYNHVKAQSAVREEARFHGNFAFVKFFVKIKFIVLPRGYIYIYLIPCMKFEVENLWLSGRFVVNQNFLQVKDIFK